ncbi:MAG: hypothetical protein ACD_62C00631G0002 [uncultured bacterium]|nr:MAG: hypothetical protein ACD_62C00631G0002 [uncultured bacterium]
MLCTFVIFYLHVFGHTDKYLFVLVPLTIAMGLLMVSAVRYKGFKRLERTSFVSMIFLVALVFVMAMEPQIMFFAFGVVYVSIGIVQWFIKTPHKIGGVRDLWNRFYEARHEDLVSDDEDAVGDVSVMEETSADHDEPTAQDQNNTSESGKVINFSK